MRRLDARIASAIAWLGLALMSASFVALVLQPGPPPVLRQIERHKRMEPFALVVLDPGHGGMDSGAMAGGVLEKDLTLDIAQRMERLLGAQGVATLMTRMGDSYIALVDRAALANRAEDAIFVSIHLNEGARPMARLIQDTVRRALADELLFGRLQHGGKVTIDIGEGEKIVLKFEEEPAAVA